MRKMILIMLFLFLFINISEGSPPSRVYTYVSGNTVDPSQNTANEDAIFSYLVAGVDTLATNAVDASGEIADGIILNADINTSAAIVGSKLDLSAPGNIGATTPGTGAFTTLSATGAITATGGQIAFPASQSASSNVNTLDDYEEGYFTATLTCGTSGTITVDTDFDQLAYTKIGRIVHVQGTIKSSAVSSPIGSLRLNLPFTTTNLTELAEGTTGSVAITLGTGNVEALTLQSATGAGAFVDIVEQVGTGTAVANDVANHIAVGSNIKVGLTYISE